MSRSPEKWDTKIARFVLAYHWNAAAKRLIIFSSALLRVRHCRCNYLIAQTLRAPYYFTAGATKHRVADFKKRKFRLAQGSLLGEPKMDFTVPDGVKRTLAEFEGRQQGFREFDLSHAIENLAKQPATLPDAERRGVWVEMIAFQFMEPAKTPKQPWNSVFAAMASMRTRNGEDRYIPDIKLADETGLRCTSPWIDRWMRSASALGGS